jgi:hypothetical protein
LASTGNYPRRCDPVEVVGAALLAAVNGLGHRRVADRSGYQRRRYGLAAPGADRQ